MKFEYSIADTVGTIMLNNPPHNLFTPLLMKNREQLVEFLLHPEVKSVVIKSSGIHFCEGADGDYYNLEEKDIKDFYKTIAFATIPVAAVLTGNCMAPGLELALSCHFRFASENALFGKSGPDNRNRMLLLPHEEAVAPLETMTKINSGSVLPAHEAKKEGLVDEVDSEENIEASAKAFLLSITENRSPHLIRTVMQSIHNGRRLDQEEALHKESTLFDSIVKNWQIERSIE